MQKIAFPDDHTPWTDKTAISSSIGKIDRPEKYENITFTNMTWYIMDKNDIIVTPGLETKHGQ